MDSLVSTEWLADHLGEAELTIVDCSWFMPASGRNGHDEFLRAHIPGARFVSMSDISVQHTSTMLMLEMLPADELRTKLEALGISDDSRIVVYYGNDWVSPSTRIIFNLDYAGLGSQTSLLDGGMAAWKGIGGETTSVIVPVKAGSLRPLKIHPTVVDADFVRAHLGAKGFAIVDGRAASFYDGVETGGGMGEEHKKGHLPGAKSIPFTSITNDDLTLRSRADLEALFTEAGVKPDDTVIGYCHIGQQATAMLFAARLIGHPVLLYDGSMQDWSRHDKSYATETASK